MMQTIKNKSITEREKEILSHMAKGLSYVEIADELIISPATVRKHTENIYKKLQVHNKIEAIQEATKKKLIKI